MLRYYRAGRYWLLEGLPVLAWPRSGGLALTENQTLQALRRVASGQAVNQYGHAENSRCARLRRDLLVRIWVIARPMPRNNRAISKGVDPFLS